MSLLLNLNLAGNTRLLVWDITEDVTWLRANVILHRTEEDTYATFNHDGRRKQWLAVRLLLQEYFKDSIKHYLIYDEFKKPFFETANRNISVSHSHQLAGIIVSETKEVGLDIESLSHDIVQLENKFLSEDELQIINNKTSNEQLHILWCAKEVMYKIYGRKKLEFKENLKIAPFTYADAGLLEGALTKEGVKMHFNIYYRQLNGYMITWGYKIINE